MPKLIKNIANFSGGLNNNTNRRDILDVESQVMLNVSNEIPGKLVMEGRTIASSISSNDVTGIDALNYGNGLLHTNLDRNFGAAGNAASECFAAENRVCLLNDGFQTMLIDGFVSRMLCDAFYALQNFDHVAFIYVRLCRVLNIGRLIFGYHRMAPLKFRS